MRCGIWVLLAVAVLFLAAGCGRSEGGVMPPTHAPNPTDAPKPTATPEPGPLGPAPVCPPARGEGTVSPAVSIDAITFVVNGLEQVVRAGDRLRASPGEVVEVKDVTICAERFSGSGGEVCADFAPVDQNGQEILSEHGGTHLIRVIPGFMTIPGPGTTWTIGENWRSFSAVVNHWPPVDTADFECGNRHCERDDRIVIELR